MKRSRRLVTTATLALCLVMPQPSAAEHEVRCSTTACAEAHAVATVHCERSPDGLSVSCAGTFTGTGTGSVRSPAAQIGLVAMVEIFGSAKCFNCPEEDSPVYVFSDACRTDASRRACSAGGSVAFPTRTIVKTDPSTPACIDDYRVSGGIGTHVYHHRRTVLVPIHGGFVLSPGEAEAYERSSFTSAQLSAEERCTA